MSKIIKHLDFVLVDLFLLFASFHLAMLACNQVAYITVANATYIIQLATLMVTWLLSLLIEQPFKNVLKRNKWNELRQTVKHIFFLGVTELLLLFILHCTGNISRIVFFLTWILFLFLSYAFRLIWKRYLRMYYRKTGGQRSALIVLCTHDNAVNTVKALKQKCFAEYSIKAIFFEDYIDSRDSNTYIQGITVSGSQKAMMSYATHSWVDDALINLQDTNDSNQSEKTDKICQHLENMGIATHKVLCSIPSDSYTIIEKYGNFVVTTHMVRNVAPIQWFLKRSMDIIGGLVGCLITGILFIFVAPAIYITSPGPIFFSQTRIGKNGKKFKMYKFRSMYLDAEKRKKELLSKNEMDGMMFKIENDPRIIKGIGHFIRKTSIDEFPQFFNVLKGDMSLVGTRPPTVDEWEKYSEHHRKRMAIKPGITGLWQISGRNDITDFEEVVALDEEYISTWTVVKDIRIILVTAKQLLTGGTGQ